MSALARLDQRARLIDALAFNPPAPDNAPSGPEVYAWNDDIRWAWVPNHDCGYSSGYCWGILVLTDSGCPNGLYVEANILSGGIVIDYTNDSVGSLAPAQSAVLEFVYLKAGSGRLKAEITKINCY